MKMKVSPAKAVADEARMLIADSQYLANVNGSDSRVIARKHFQSDDGIGWDYCLVQFPDVASADRRGQWVPSSEWHVYEADEPWDCLDKGQAVGNWIGQVDEDSDPAVVRNAWWQVLLGIFAVIATEGDDPARLPMPWIGVYPVPSGPSSPPVLTMVLRWQRNGRTVFVSEAPVLWLPGAAEFHARWSAPVVSIKVGRHL